MFKVTPAAMTRDQVKRSSREGTICVFSNAVVGIILGGFVQGVPHYIGNSIFFINN